MNNKIFLTINLVMICVFSAINSTHGAEDSSQNQSPKLLASGADFAIHQFKGSVGTLFSRPVLSGTIISHTNLKSGKMTWLVKTGVYSHPTARISYSCIRLVGLAQDKKYLLVVLFNDGRRFRSDAVVSWRNIKSKQGGYTLSVFSKATGKGIYHCGFGDPKILPTFVPRETTEAGVIKKNKEGYRIFDRIFLLKKLGEVINNKYIPLSKEVVSKSVIEGK